ncbi:hypothetical protein BDP81DRAFT_159135 [Colletotrichum phormii]|uniref:Uncharacterized protein n=1 Tax=Colletotrichum phormii TaxID=359342 RepID=A0AAI9ZXQ5_9PEZI|nr:uncharacterized protein BDP81DRAFT_159135 [Colletotrichum phormii]KAK1640159.1 hypothetical protein BDP81DRAFT_159135 [Colletotrichum phormii]
MRTLHRLMNGRDVEAWHAARIPKWGKRVCARSCKQKWFIISIRSCPLLARQGTYRNLTTTGTQSASQRDGSILNFVTLSFCGPTRTTSRRFAWHFFRSASTKPPPRTAGRKNRPHNSHLTIAIVCLAARPPGREDHCRCDPNPKLTDNPQRP